MRETEPPVIGVIRDGRLLLDCRTLTDDEVDEVAAAVVLRAQMSEPSPDERVWNLIRGALGTRALAIVAELGVADALADGPRPVAEVAQGGRRRPGHAAPAAARARERGRLRRARARRLREHGRVGADPPRGGLGRLRPPLRRRLVPHDGRARRRPASRRSRRLFGTDFWAWLAAHPDERAAFDRSMQQGMERTGRAPRRRRLARRRDGRRRRRRERVASRRAPAAPPGLRGIVFDLPETVRDEETLGRADRVRRGRLLRPGARGRRLHPLGDPPRLERRACGRDPPHDPRRGPARRTLAGRRRRRRGRERAGRDEVARPPHARAARRPRAQRAPVARASSLPAASRRSRSATV